MSYGTSFTVRVISAWPGNPSLSLTSAESTWTPGVRLLVVTLPPFPSGPLTSELHTNELARSPSSLSIAVATRSAASPRFTVAPSDGDVMVTTGAPLTVSVISPLPGWLPLSEIEGAGAVLGDLRWPEGTARALAEASRRGIPAILDADASPPNEGSEAFAAASHLLFSSQGLSEWTGLAEIEEGLRLAAARTDAWVGVSAGQAGVYWLEEERLRHLPAFAVEVVDTVGAGDVMHGAFALGLARRESIENALRFACAAAALKCTRPGGRAGAPRANEVERLLEAGADAAKGP